MFLRPDLTNELLTILQQGHELRVALCSFAISHLFPSLLSMFSPLLLLLFLFFPPFPSSSSSWPLSSSPSPDLRSPPFLVSLFIWLSSFFCSHCEIWLPHTFQLQLETNWLRREKALDTTYVWRGRGLPRAWEQINWSMIKLLWEGIFGIKKKS